MATGPVRVVIVGAGYTAVWAVLALQRRLGRRLREGDVEITVVAPKTYHSFHGWTAESVTGIVASQNRQSPLRRLLRGHRFILAHATAVDPAQRTVAIAHVEGGRAETLAYDHLLIASGARDNVEAAPGLARHGYSVKAAGGVERVRNALLTGLEAAQGLPPGPERDAWLTVVVAGGGFAGVELSANIAEMFEGVKRYYPVLAETKPRVVLVHSGDALLPVLRPRFDSVAAYATRQLQKYGVEIVLGTKLVEVTDDGATLSSGVAVPARMVISTVGQTVVTLPGTEAFARNGRGLLVADAFLRVKDQDNVWTGGDAAEVPHVKGGSCPTNALWAIKHGVWAGGNIARAIAGKRLKRFTYPGLGQAASLGVGKGAGELYGVPVTGWVGWFARFFFFLYYQPSSRNAARVFFDWVLFAALGRQITITRNRERP